jgi:hypothetical protein
MLQLPERLRLDLTDTLARVLLDRNLLQDIAATRSIRVVVLCGRTFDRAALDAIFAETRAKVSKWNASSELARRPLS